jgi:hypothetical protein
MKHLPRIFDLSKSEQRVVLIIMFILITTAFVEYQRRVHRPIRPTSATEAQPSPSPVQTEDEH